MLSDGPYLGGSESTYYFWFPALAAAYHNEQRRDSLVWCSFDISWHFRWYLNGDIRATQFRNGRWEDDPRAIGWPSHFELIFLRSCAMLAGPASNGNELLQIWLTREGFTVSWVLWSARWSNFWRLQMDLDFVYDLCVIWGMINIVESITMQWVYSLPNYRTTKIFVRIF